LTSELAAFDPRLRVRWSEPLGQFSIERKYGRAGDNQKILEILQSSYRLAVEREDPKQVGLWDEFCARRDGYQPILYITKKAAEHPALVIEQLATVDIRRHGGAIGYWKAKIEEDGRAEAAKKKAGQEKLREALEEGYDRAKAGKKDWYAGGEMEYPVPVKPTTSSTGSRKPSLRTRRYAASTRARTWSGP
jgi:hypothetical protein